MINVTIPLIASAVFCTAGAPFGQSVSDLNSLVSLAGQFANQAMAAQGDPEELELFLLGGTRGGPGTPRTETDLRHWVLTYAIRFPERTSPRHGGVAQHSLQVDWRQGSFTGITWSPVPVMPCKSLEGIRFDVPVAEAVRSLNQAGVTGGFSVVNVVWPVDAHHQDCPTYLFICPKDEVTVGISAQDGGVLWRESWNPPVP